MQRSEDTGEPDEPRRHGSIPRSRRKVALGALLAVGVVIIVISAIGIWISGIPGLWPSLLMWLGVVLAAYSFYLWIRLSD